MTVARVQHRFGKVWLGGKAGLPEQDKAMRTLEVSVAALQRLEKVPAACWLPPLTIWQGFRPWVGDCTALQVLGYGVVLSDPSGL